MYSCIFLGIKPMCYLTLCVCLYRATVCVNIILSANCLLGIIAYCMLRGSNEYTSTTSAVPIRIQFITKTSTASYPAAGWGGGGGGCKKHEIYGAAFGGHLFMTYFYKAGGGMAPLGTPLDLLLIQKVHIDLTATEFKC